MYKIKLTFPYPKWPLERQTSNEALILGNYCFFLNDNKIKECDYWIIYEDGVQKEKVKCPNGNIIFIAGEGPETHYYSQAFLNQFDHIITCLRTLNHPNIHFNHTGNPWFVGKNYDFLIQNKQVIKKKIISVVCSNNQEKPGHKKRYDFCIKLKEHFGDKIDLFGRNIKGFDDKWDVLHEYMYSVVIENAYSEDWFTEKLYDCFCAHTLPLYYGCPNLSNYFNEESFIRIDIDDFEKSVKIIENLLNSPEEYYNRLSSLIKAKEKYLYNYNLFPLIINFIETGKFQTTQKMVWKTVKEKKIISSNFFSRVKSKIKKIL